MRFFNTEGPVRPDDHYAIPPLARMGVEELLGPIRAKRYFVLHAPRQLLDGFAALLRRGSKKNHSGRELVCAARRIDPSGGRRTSAAYAVLDPSARSPLKSNASNGTLPKRRMAFSM